MVGVAVQAVPVTVKSPPKEVRLLPETVKVLSKVVAPCRVRVPVELPIVVAAVPVEFTKAVPKMVVAPLIALVPPDTPMVLAANVPVPKVLVREEPVPSVVAPDDVNVVKAPVLAVPDPMAPGTAKVAPLRELAFKLGTLVVEVTTSGAVPIATVEVSWVPETPAVEVIAPDPIVPVTVKSPPKEVRLLPETVKVLSKVVAPCKVRVPVELPIVVAAVPVEFTKAVPKMVVAPRVAMPVVVKF
jgi:hypothetical protein